MCDYAGRLVAWLDGELPQDEATNVGWHIAHCEECRRALSAYQEISKSFLDCYEAAMVSDRRRNRVRWAPALGVAAAAAVLGAAILLWPRPVEQLTLNPPPAVHAPAIAFERTQTVAAAGHPRHRKASDVAQSATSQSMTWRPVEPSVQISIPAEAMFPPGAVPAGFNFVTRVSFAADGLPQGLPVWP